MLHVCRDLFMFVHGDRFINLWHNPACPTGGVSFWTTRQGGGDMGENIASTEGTITAVDGANVKHNEVMTVTLTKLVVVVGPLTMAIEMGTHAFVLYSMLGGACPVVESILPLVSWIEQN